MPVNLVVEILKARDLPVMDSRTNSADAYAEVKVADQPVRMTKIVKKSLNPHWNKKFQYELAFDKKIQDSPIVVRVIDKDMVTRNDVIGSVYIDLSPALMSYSGSIRGWFPIFDTMRGMRGELRVAVTMEFIGDQNPWRNSSAGVQFFSIATPPDAQIVSCCGFVSELVMKPDPEYALVDSFRASRVSNTERQQTFSALAGKLRRRLGLKAQELDCNAVLCYRQHFDIESTLGMIVGRGYGTLCRIGVPTPGDAAAQTSVMPNVLSLSELRGVSFLTLDRIPVGYRVNVGGTVVARSVELLRSAPVKKMKKKRERWWNEIRSQIRGHARALGCSLVLGYREESTIDGDLLLLSATGTAAQLCQTLPPQQPAQSQHQQQSASMTALDVQPTATPSTTPTTTPMPSDTTDDDESTSFDTYNSLSPDISDADSSDNDYSRAELGGGYSDKDSVLDACTLCHLSPAASYTSAHVCGVCRQAPVPMALLATIEPPLSLAVLGEPHFLQARVCRKKRKLTGEANAIEVSRIVPFIEFDLHRQIMYKLRLLCANAVFGLRFQVAIGPKLIVAVATGTARLLPALPAPHMLLEVELPPAPTNESHHRYRPELLKKIARQCRANFRKNIIKHPQAALVYRSPAGSDSSASTSTAAAAAAATASADSDGHQTNSNMNEKEPAISYMLAILDGDGKRKIRYHSKCAVLLPPAGVSGFIFETIESAANPFVPHVIKLFSSLNKVTWDVSKHHIDAFIGDLIERTKNMIIWKLRHHSLVQLQAVRCDLRIHEDNEVLCLVTGVVLIPSIFPTSPSHSMSRLHTAAADDDAVVPSDEPAVSIRDVLREEPAVAAHGAPVQITTMSYLPGFRTEMYHGHVRLHLIREKQNIQPGGFDKFFELLLISAKAIARAHVAALGGNAMVGFCVEDCVVKSTQASRSGYVFLSISGDAVSIVPIPIRSSTSKSKSRALLNSGRATPPITTTLSSGSIGQSLSLSRPPSRADERSTEAAKQDDDAGKKPKRRKKSREPPAAAAAAAVADDERKQKKSRALAQSTSGVATPPAASLQPPLSDSEDAGKKKPAKKKPSDVGVAASSTGSPVDSGERRRTATKEAKK